VLRTRADSPGRLLSASVAGVAALCVLAGLTGLLVHQHHGSSGAPAVSDIGVVSTPSPAPSPTTQPSTTPTLGTHSTELGAQGANGAAPRRVSIPRLHVRARPVPAGLAPDNRSLDLLPSATTVVWWAYGATPGASSGTVLLAGHISWAGRLGTLNRIGTLRVGDRVTLTRQDGRTVHYAVTGRRRVPKAALGDLGLFATSGAPRLVLVTCGGPYDASRHSYADNVVVQARPVA
jgi:sortase (surface protein transpeptidase)